MFGVGVALVLRREDSIVQVSLLLPSCHHSFSDADHPLLRTHPIRHLPSRRKNDSAHRRDPIRLIIGQAHPSFASPAW